MAISDSDNKIWHKGYVDVYDTITHYVPYIEHLDRIIDHLSPKSGMCLLDMGCGTGELIKKISGSGISCTGVDASEQMLAQAKRKNPAANLMLCDLAHRLPFGDSSFDRVVSNNVLSYLDSPAIFASEMLRVLKPGGIFVVATLKPTFSPSKIFLEHMRRSGLAGTAKVLLPSLLVGFYNKKITNSLNKKSFTGYTQESLRDLFNLTGATNLLSYDSYANQDAVVRGSK